MGFCNDLKFGKKYEKLALKYVEYNDIEFKKGCFKPYDFIADGKTKYEIKSDRMGHRTGNMAIEYFCNNKPSGITSTEADYWIYFVIYPDKTDCYKFPTAELRELIKDCRKVSGGDGYRSRLSLLPITSCAKYLTHPV